MSGIEGSTKVGARAEHRERKRERETAKAKCTGISLQARGEQLNNCIPCKWNIGYAVPCESQKLEDTKK